jgi:hypothetical protein
MDADERMVKPSCNLIRRKSSVFDPKSKVIKRFRYADLNQFPIDADILVGVAVSSGPAPNIAEHPRVQVPSK